METKHLNETIDRLMKNAEALNDIGNKEEFAFERKALESIQDSLLDYLLDIKESDKLPKKIDRNLESLKAIAKGKNFCKQSNFRKKANIRKARKKQAV